MERFDYINIIMHRLMVKIHLTTGLKYLCYTQRDDWQKYTGSGVLWKKHLEEHGQHFSTELLFETENYAEFKEFAIKKSKEFNVVDSNEWANLKLEEGDGGDTVSSKMWITNGEEDKYILKETVIPNGWRKGRCKCIFNDPNRQKEFAARVDLEKRGKALKQAWSDGKFDSRDHSKCAFKPGKDNVACRPEVREKLRKAALEQSAERAERIKVVKPWLKSSRNSKKHD